MQAIEHIKGNRFLHIGTVLNLQRGQDLSLTTITSEVRTKCGGTLIETLTFTWITVNESFTLTSATDTSDWPTGELYFDVRFETTPSNAVHSSTGKIQVSTGITRP